MPLFPREMAETFWMNDRKVIESKCPMEFEEDALQDDGLHTYISIKFPLFDAIGEPYAAVATKQPWSTANLGATVEVTCDRTAEGLPQADSARTATA